MFNLEGWLAGSRKYMQFAIPRSYDPSNQLVCRRLLLLHDEYHEALPSEKKKHCLIQA